MGRVLSTLPGAEAAITRGVRYVVVHEAFGTFVARVLYVHPGWCEAEVIEPNGKMRAAGLQRGDKLELSAAFCTFREVG